MKFNILDKNDMYYMIEKCELLKECSREEIEQLVAMREKARDLFFDEVERKAELRIKKEEKQQYDLDTYDEYIE